MTDIQIAIKHDFQIKKFCFYGFFKNLKFFEPYLLIYLLGLNLNLFQIGLLFSIRGIIIFVFEVPSGIIADHYGKKKELLMCFIFYIISFILFFISTKLLVITIAIIFFGLGEAFRSGTHKSMILSYLEHKDWYVYKNYVYGRTRSYSLLGSSISAFLSILFILNLPSVRWIFLASIIPYILDFILILSYPEFLDEKKQTSMSIKGFYQLSIRQLREVNQNLQLKKILSSSAIFESIFETIKDYIQPILSLLILSVGTVSLLNLTLDDTLKVYLGVLYGIFYIFSSLASKNVYRLSKLLSSHKLFEGYFTIMGLILLLLSVTLRFNGMIFTVLLFFTLYILKDSRRPLFLDVCSDYMSKHQRVTSLSIESQLKSILSIIIAPLFGWLADQFSISTLFLIIAICIIVLTPFLNIQAD